MSQGIRPGSEPVEPLRCPVHRILAHLKRFAGLPVPATVKWIDGKPDFRQIDEEKYEYFLRLRLCGVCGKPLKGICYWIGGPGSFKTGFFNDLPMHYECATESARLCPFLNKKKPHYRGTLPDSGLTDTSGRPANMYIMSSLTKNLMIVEWNGAAAIAAGPGLRIRKEF